ncbi:MAG: glycosyltransferase family 4 protein [Clostridia bacterium]|nr:glycosyltransferase family 4 protein [Clostridia bacterium]
MNGPSVHLITDILKRALGRGHNVDVVLKKINDNNPETIKMLSEFDGFSYHYIKNTPSSGFINRYISEVKYAKKCSEYYIGKKYDAVFLQSCTNAYFHMRYLKKLSCPVIFNVQDIFPYNLKLSGQLPFSKIVFPIFRFLQNRGYKKASKIITISEDMKNTLVNDGVNSSKIYTVCNWSYSDSSINFEDINSENVFDFGKNKDKFNVIYSGNVGKMQGLEIVVRAAKLTENDEKIHYYIIGDGSNKEKIKDMAKGLDNLTLLPMQPSKFSESIYSQADINVIPLSAGGIKTALPSKTATCLRTNKNIVFCIEKDSIFAKEISQYKNVSVCNAQDENELVRIINKIRLGEKSFNGNYSIDYVKEIMSYEHNPEKYIDIIENSTDYKKKLGK